MKDKRIWIGNGTAVFQDRMEENSSVLVEDGRITGIGIP